MKPTDIINGPVSYSQKKGNGFFVDGKLIAVMTTFTDVMKGCDTYDIALVMQQALGDWIAAAINKKRLEDLQQGNLVDTYMEIHRGLDLSKVFALYDKVVNVQEWLGPNLKWSTLITFDDIRFDLTTPGLYYKPMGLARVILRIKELGGTRVQLRCVDKAGEYGYPDYAIDELLAK